MTILVDAEIELRISKIDKHMASNPTLATRECGDCTLCCNLPPVPALDKSAREWCKHCSPRGCAIYEARPVVCRTWYCGYRANTFKWPDGSTTVLGEHWRPNKCGMVVHPPHSTFLGIMVRGGDEGRWRAEPWLQDVHMLAGLARQQGLWFKIDEPRGQYLFDPRPYALGVPPIFIATHEEVIQLGSLPLLKAHTLSALTGLSATYDELLAKAGLPASSQDEGEGIRIMQVAIDMLEARGLTIDERTRGIKRVKKAKRRFFS